MKKRESCWKRFERTGDIRDYLSYTACTREEAAAECHTAVQIAVQNVCGRNFSRCEEMSRNCNAIAEDK